MEHNNIELSEDETAYMAQTLVDLLNSRGPAEEHVEVPTSDEVSPEDEIVDLNSLSLVGKLREVLDTTLSDVLIGMTALESAEEALVLAQAVTICEHLDG